MKTKFYTILFVAFLFIAASESFGQGCVAVRNMASCSLMSDSLPNRSWQVSLNYRFFRSYKHFRGTHEETERVEQGTEVINLDNSLLFGLNYNLNNRWSVGLTIPYLNIDRSSLYEHYGNQPGNPRFHTQAKGLGDLRIIGYFAALPNSHQSHLLLGLGVKLPTGNYNYKDYFHKKDSEGQDSLVYKPVDQSIQPGDGGTGLIVEFDFVQQLARNFQLYAAGTYMFNPRNTNGTLRSATLTNGIPLSNEMSVCDQFLFRLGGRYAINKFQFAAGGRIEGIPAKDLVGESDGFRRPGYIVSIEPAVAYFTGKHSVGVNFPIAIERNRTQSVLDQKRTEITGTYQHGDAAFADWLISVSYSYRIGH
ncbi:MAG: transporter [Cyclobacteriaceae bacterium]|nr:transporter [Cyclobacteriaceae bacterium]